jgi:hypothetical protein
MAKKSPGRYLTSFLDLTKNVGLSEGLFSGHFGVPKLGNSREQKIPNFGLWRPKKLRNLEKGEKLSKMSCFVMAFSGVLEKNKVFRSQKIACGVFCCQLIRFSLKKHRRREKIVFLVTCSKIFGVLDLTKNLGFSKIPS